MDEERARTGGGAGGSWNDGKRCRRERLFDGKDAEETGQETLRRKRGAIEQVERRKMRPRGSGRGAIKKCGDNLQRCSPRTRPLHNKNQQTRKS